MVNSTDEYWSVIDPGGVEVSLNQYCWAVQSFGGSPRGLPPLRGDEQTFPHRPGQAFRPKQAAARTIGLEMFVNGIDPSTDQVSADPDMQWNVNWAALQRLFYTPERQIDLIRRWKSPAGMVKGTAKAQIAGSMDPSMTSRSRATFTVDLQLSDPYFYSDEIVVELDPRDSFTMVHSSGSVPTTGFGVEIRALDGFGWYQQKSGFKLSNAYWGVDGQAHSTTTYPDHWVSYSRSQIAPGVGVYDNETLSMYPLYNTAVTTGFVLALTSTVGGSSVLMASDASMGQFYTGQPVRFDAVTGLTGVSPGVTYYIHSFDYDYGLYLLTSAPGGSVLSVSGSGTATGLRAVEPTVTTAHVASLGRSQWLTLYPGWNRITVTDIAGAAMPVQSLGGTLELRYREPFV